MFKLFVLVFGGPGEEGGEGLEDAMEVGLHMYAKLSFHGQNKQPQQLLPNKKQTNNFWAVFQKRDHCTTR